MSTPPVYRTPEERFANLTGFPFVPHYREIGGLRMHYVDEGTAEASASTAWQASVAKPMRAYGGRNR